jgi:AbrB family looped-hinge helix DNA binding protein
MKATITSKVQITIPVRIRRKLRLKEGDVLEFDEEATVLTARRVVDPGEWERGLEALRESWGQGDPDHPRQRMDAAAVMDDLRGPPSASTGGKGGRASISSPTS